MCPDFQSIPVNAVQRWALYGIWCPLYVSSHRYIIYALAYTFSLKRKPFGGSGPSALLSAAVLDRALLSAGLLLLWTCHPAARPREYSLKAALEKLITVTPRNEVLLFSVGFFGLFFPPTKYKVSGQEILRNTPYTYVRIVGGRGSEAETDEACLDWRLSAKEGENT